MKEQSARRMVFNRRRRTLMAKAVLILIACFCAVTLISTLGYPMDVETIMEVVSYHTHDNKVLLKDDDGTIHEFYDRTMPKDIKIGRLVLVELWIRLTRFDVYYIEKGWIRWDVQVGD